MKRNFERWTWIKYFSAHFVPILAYISVHTFQGIRYRRCHWIQTEINFPIIFPAESVLFLRKLLGNRVLLQTSEKLLLRTSQWLFELCSISIKLHARNFGVLRSRTIRMHHSDESSWNRPMAQRPVTGLQLSPNGRTIVVTSECRIVWWLQVDHGCGLSVMMLVTRKFPNSYSIHSRLPTRFSSLVLPMVSYHSFLDLPLYSALHSALHWPLHCPSSLLLH